MTRQVSTGEHFITTAPTATTCRHCFRPVLAATVGGLDVRVDTDPLTLAGELGAVLAGRPTFDLRGELLAYRTAVRIRSGEHLPVLAAHDCSAPVPPDLVDQVHMETAVFLVRRLLGGTVVDTRTNPPY